MKSGDCINIPEGVKHWRGAAPDSRFSHLDIKVHGENGSNEWLEAVDDEQYGGGNEKFFVKITYKFKSPCHDDRARYMSWQI